MKTINENLLIWEQRIKERKQRGIKIVDWCKQNGVSIHQYYYWNHRIHESKRNKPDQEITFAEDAPVLSDSNNTEPIANSLSNFQIFFKEIQVTGPCGFNPAELAGLMKVLHEL